MARHNRVVRLALVLPGVAIGFAGAIILGPGNTRPAEGARLYVAPPVGDHIRSARLIAVRRLDGAEEPASGLDLVVRAGEQETQARTGADGVAELPFDPPVAPGSALLVRAAERVLLDGVLEVPDGAAPSTQPASASGRFDGELRVRIAPVRGQLSPPFPEAVTVRLTRREGAVDVDVAGTVIVDLVGGSPAHTTLTIDPAKGPAHIEIVAEALRVDLEARGEDGAGHRGTFSGSLETVAGALWVDPASTGELRVASPAPRRAAYASLHDQRGRVAGFAIPLEDDGHGFHRGAVTLPPGREGTAVIVVSGDAEESGPSTVAWPLGDAMGSATAPRLLRALDGVAPAEAAERARAVRARRLAVAVAAVCGLVSIIALLLEGRRAQRALDAHLRRASEGAADETQEGILAVGRGAARSATGFATVLGALVALAFGVVAALVLVR